MTTLLESAFNTFYDYDVDFEKIHSHEFVQGYKHHFDELTKIFGSVDFKDIDVRETKKIAQDMADRAFAYGLDKFGDVAEATMDTIAAGMGLTGVGIPAGAMTAAAGWALDEVLDKIAGMISEEDVPLVKGDWCVMDESGLFRRRLPSAGAVEFGGGQTATSANTKLCVMLGEHGNDREVFNVESGHTRTVARQYVKRVDQSHQKELDGNGVLRALKGGLEKSKTYDQLVKEVNVRPGDKVGYKGELWEIAPIRQNVSKQFNQKVLITSNGRYAEVAWGELTAALNGTTAKPLPPDNLGSFVSDAQGINIGDWVYELYPELNEYHLGVVMTCRGNDAYIVSANMRDDDHWAKADVLRKWKEQTSTGTLGKWRVAVIYGDNNGISDYRPDKTHTGLVDIFQEGAEKSFQPRVASAYMEDAPILPARTSGEVAAVPVADKQYLAKAIELGVDYEDRTQDFSNPPSRFYTKGRGWEAPDDYNLEDRLQTFGLGSKKDEESNMQGMYLIGGICVAGILLYVYK